MTGTLTLKANKRTLKDDKGAIYLVSCVAKKQQRTCKAKELYQSDWFCKARRLVESRRGQWFILSAAYGLVHPETVVEPYDKTLNNMPILDRRAWAREVLNSLLSLDAGRFVFLAGAKYREFLTKPLKNSGREVLVPMEGLKIGEQLRWLQSHTHV